ncbi:MAG: glycerol-3-phosphate dehydrogenase, partial [Acidobacteriota bacterium]|nr:glycerol-3-phosphate dehydrogenase [Acidobacteriota bacterium]
MSSGSEALAIVGGGAWGTALACALSPRFGEVRLWVFEEGLAEKIQRSRTNWTFLPGIALPDNVAASNSLEEVLFGARIVISVMPSHVV